MRFRMVELFRGSKMRIMFLVGLIALLNCDAQKTQQDLKNATSLGRALKQNRNETLTGLRESDQNQGCQLAPHTARHVLKPGETLQDLAIIYRTDQNSILKANGIENWDHVKPGQTILIPIKDLSTQ